jgi:hypothetical protein
MRMEKNISLSEMERTRALDFGSMLIVLNKEASLWSLIGY